MQYFVPIRLSSTMITTGNISEAIDDVLPHYKTLEAATSHFANYPAEQDEIPVVAVIETNHQFQDDEYQLAGYLKVNPKQILGTHYIKSNVFGLQWADDFVPTQNNKIQYEMDFLYGVQTCNVKYGNRPNGTVLLFLSHEDAEAYVQEQQKTFDINKPMSKYHVISAMHLPDTRIDEIMQPINTSTLDVGVLTKPECVVVTSTYLPRDKYHPAEVIMGDAGSYAVLKRMADNKEQAEMCCAPLEFDLQSSDNEECSMPLSVLEDEIDVFDDFDER